jgi:hypothetical protein
LHGIRENGWFVAIPNLGDDSCQSCADGSELPSQERLGANLEECYPEMTSRIVICNAPSFAAMLWWVAKSFLPQRVIDKVCIVTAAGTAAALLEVIDSSVLPKIFGGDSEVRWEMGNTVRE